MAIKVYSTPTECPTPKFDYMSSNPNKWEEQEKAHGAAIKAHFAAQGYTGKNSGRIYREGVADGYAKYMVFEAPRGSNLREKFFLIHLDWCDGYQSCTVRFMSKTGIIEIMDSSDEFDRICASGE